MVSSDDERAPNAAKDQISGPRPASATAEESLPLSGPPALGAPAGSEAGPLASTATLADVSGAPSLGKFRLVRVVGRGAFGEVFRAYDTELDRYVAVKLPRHGDLSSNEESLFLREAKNVSRLKHPGIVPVFDVGRTESACYIISEFVDGPTLAQEAEKRRFSFRETADLVAQLADALDYAHREGIVHRDLKPSNVLLEIRSAGSSISLRGKAPKAGPRFVARIVDFGLCKRGLSGASISGENEVLGTPAYMSPEQAAGESYAVDGRSDIYSLGVILYRLLTGDVPFRGDLSNVLEHVVHNPPRRPRGVDPSIPLDLEVICLKCLAKSPHDRYPIASDLAADLRRWLDDMPIVARPTSRFERAWRWCRRYPALASMILITGLVTIVGGTAVLLQWREKQVAGKQAAEAMIDRLIEAPSSRLDAELVKVRAAINELEPELRRRLREDTLSDHARLRLQLAVLPVMPELAEAIAESMLTTIDAHEFLVLRAELSPYAKRLLPRLARTESEQQRGGDRARALRAALALVQYANNKGEAIARAEFISTNIVNTVADQTATWAQAAQGLKPELVPALERMLLSPDSSKQSRLAACRALAQLCADEPPALVRLVTAAEADEQVILIQALLPHRDEAALLLKPELEAPLLADEDEAAELAARRRANVLCALLQLGHEADVWPQLVHRSDPRVQSYFIHNAAASRVSPQVLAAQLSREADAGALYAILLALAGYSEKDFPSADRQRAVGELRDRLLHHGDAGVHAAARWLLEQWDANADVKRNITPQMREVRDGRDWYYNALGQLMVIVRGDEPTGKDGPITDAEAGDRSPDAWRKVRWTYAISATETTWEDYLRFCDAHKSPFHKEPNLDVPVVDVSCLHALAYCRWLDRQNAASDASAVSGPEGCAAEVTNAAIEFRIDMNRPGYRLPTEAEWERAARSGTSSSRFFGGGNTPFADKYIQGRLTTSPQPVGAKMPNQFGLFDVLGNVHEWTLDETAFPKDDSQLVLGSSRLLLQSTKVATRGGSYVQRERDVHPLVRLGQYVTGTREQLGFRVARTISNGER